MMRLALALAFTIVMGTPQIVNTSLVWYAGPAGSGTTCSSGSPCTIQQAITTAAAGDTVFLQDGTYSGSNSQSVWFALWFGSSGHSGSPGAPITLKALNDGKAIIDGGNARPCVQITFSSHWILDGFDCVNSTFSSIDLQNGDDFVVRRITAYSNVVSARGGNYHCVSLEDITNSTFEDLGCFGNMRTAFTEHGSGSSAGGGNRVNRLWCRWDGYTGNGGPQACMQTGYNTINNMLVENVIFLWTRSMGLSQDGGASCPGSCINFHYNNGTGGFTLGYPPGAKLLGGLFYGLASAAIKPETLLFSVVDVGRLRLQDLVAIKSFAGNVNGEGTFLFTGAVSPTPNAVANRITSVKDTAGNASAWGSAWALTSFNENTSAQGLLGRNIFTTGTGEASICYQYANGVRQDGSGGTTAKPMFPWPMDDRIKAAITRSGLTTLSGSAGTGYAAGTPTSDVVAMLAALPNGPTSIPANCLSGAVTPPPILSAPDFPSTLTIEPCTGTGTLTNWTTVGGSGLQRSTNKCVPISGFTVSRFNTSYPSSKEAWDIIDPLPNDGENHIVYIDIQSSGDRYGVYVSRVVGATDQIGAFKLISSVQTDLMTPIDLGLEASLTDRLGARYEGNSQLNIYYYAQAWGEWRIITSIPLTTIPSGGGYIGVGLGSGGFNTYGGGQYVTAPSVTAPGANKGTLGTGVPTR